MEKEQLTKREQFAAMAMQGYCANAELEARPHDILAEWAKNQADALIKELAK